MWDAEISILDRCTGRQLKELLAIASTDARTAREWLLAVSDWEQMENLLTEMSSGAKPSGAELLQAACSPKTPVENLVAAKSAAKRFTVAAEVPAQKAAATLLYHLAVASALAYHSRNISSNDPATRLALYKDLAAELSDDDLADVFEKAATRISSGSI